MKLEDIFQLIEDVRDKASVSAAYGEPVTVGDKIVIPVADVKFGFGLGYGEGGGRREKEEQEAEQDTPGGQGGGAGGGVAARPVAVLEITEEKVKVKPVLDEGRIALAGMLTGAWIIFWFAMTLKALFGKR